MKDQRAHDAGVADPGWSDEQHGTAHSHRFHDGRHQFIAKQDGRLVAAAQAVMAAPIHLLYEEDPKGDDE
jgi:hypothetical protein